MTALHPTSSHLPLPALYSSGEPLLEINSTLGELLLHQFQVESFHTGMAIAAIFEQYPSLPGVVVMQRDRLLGMLSRQQLLEYAIRARGIELFLSQSLGVLYGYSRYTTLILPQQTPILVAAQHALRRSPIHQGEPIVVQVDAQTYCLLDIHELNVAYWQIRGIETQVRYERTQLQLLQTEKMASLGRLVDGVAHEILDPVGFIWGNLVHVSDYTQQLLDLLKIYDREVPDLPETIQHYREEFELDYVQTDLPRAIDSIKTGAERLKKLVSSLQNFCHIDQVYPKPADIHECLDSLLLLLKSRLTGDIDIVKHYGHLPPVTCYIGQLSQVFMNILTNAVDAMLNETVQLELASKFDGRELEIAGQLLKPQITITTEVRPQEQACATPSGTQTVSRWAAIRIADNGPGLSPQQLDALLECFSIKQRTAKETSLSVSYQIVTAKHGGQLKVRSPITSNTLTSGASETNPPLNRGTEFEILLPLL